MNAVAQTTAYDTAAVRTEIASADARARAALNTSGIQPTEFCVLFLPDPVEEKTASGVYLPDQFKDREEARCVMGTLVAVSPVAFDYADWPEGSRAPEAGDRVIVSRHAGLTVKGRDGKDYRLLKDKEVLALLESEA